MSSFNSFNNVFFQLKSFLEPFDGLVIQTYGSGNIPSNQTELIKILKDAIQRGILIVNISVCLEGTVSGIYQTGKVLNFCLKF